MQEIQDEDELMGLPLEKLFDNENSKIRIGLTGM